MINIKWDANFNTLRTQLERSVLAQVEKAITTAVGNAKCKVHGEEPSVAVSGKGFDSLSFQVEGCCPEIIALVEKRLGNL